MKKGLVLCFAALLLFSCEKKVVQFPVSYNNDDFLERSQERGKILLQEETQWFSEYITNSPLKFNKTSAGFWISNDALPEPANARTGDYVEFTYQVTDLDDTVIYSFQENGIKKVILGKADLARGLHSALQLIDEGESVKILLPSFLGYGGYGDQGKIGPDQPIIMEVAVSKIKKH